MSKTNGNSYRWWEDKEFVAELDRVHDAMESGEDKGYTWEEVIASIDELRKKKYGNSSSTLENK